MTRGSSLQVEPPIAVGTIAAIFNDNEACTQRREPYDKPQAAPAAWCSLRSRSGSDRHPLQVVAVFAFGDGFGREGSRLLGASGRRVLRPLGAGGLDELPDRRGGRCPSAGRRVP